MYLNAAKETVILLVFLFVGLFVTAQHKSYFISHSGNDANDGLSISSSWRTIDKVNTFPFQPGDVIQFEGGASFSGTIKFNQSHSGRKDEPIKITSYGAGKATILAGYSNGIEIFNAEYVEVKNLAIKGDGIYKNDGQGIHVHTQRSDKMLSGIVIDHVDVSGFYWGGIGVGAAPEATKGFYGLRITNSSVFENGFVGIQSWGAWNDDLGKSLFNHVGLYIGHTKAYNNNGISTYTYDWSGSGIIMAGVENGLIEYCEAYNNGKDNGCKSGGPVGIWLANAKDCIIQYCESYSNKAGKSKDGGGFDIDGGSQNCIIQYNFSHDNEGPGYALFEWGNNIPFTGNVIRYNISQDDARKNSYGAITLWGASSKYKILNSHVYNNTVYVSKTGLINGTPAAVKFLNANMKDVKIRNNIFYVTEGVQMIHSTTAFDSTVAHFQNNNYFDTTGIPSFYFLYNYPSLSSWKNAVPGQEMRGPVSLGYASNPLLVSPGGAKTISPTEGGELAYVTAYMIQPESPMIDAGMNLHTVTGLDIGRVDYYKNSLSDIKLYDIGANEFNANKFMVMPLKIIAFTAAAQKGKLYVEWALQPNPDLLQVELQVSSDGKSFRTVKSYHHSTLASILAQRELTDYPFQGTIYCRLKAVSTDKTSTYSSIKRLTNAVPEKENLLFPNPVKDKLNVSISVDGLYSVVIKNAVGHTLYEEKLVDAGKAIAIQTAFLKPGYYLLELKEAKSKTIKTIPFVKQ